MAADLIEKVMLGRSDLAVSKICFGTSSLGDMPDTYGYQSMRSRPRRLSGPFSQAL
jgi:D-threo-aldose 1-dehydrogenase